MKNKHLLLITATVAFLTFYIPVACFTDYVNHIPLWALPIFWIVTQIPFWFNELAWRTSRIGSDSYNMFHQLHYDGKEWKNRKASIWLIIFSFFKWWIKEPMCVGGSLITLAALGYGMYDFFMHELFEPFLPYYIFMGLWWMYFTMSFFEFKEKVKYGYVSYGKRKKSTTHFSPEWYEEQERLQKLNNKK
jgi:hypothetical protein